MVAHQAPPSLGFSLIPPKEENVNNLALQNDKFLLHPQKRYHMSSISRANTQIASISSIDSRYANLWTFDTVHKVQLVVLWKSPVTKLLGDRKAQWLGAWLLVSDRLGLTHSLQWWPAGWTWASDHPLNPQFQHWQLGGNTGFSITNGSKGNYSIKDY